MKILGIETSGSAASCAVYDSVNNDISGEFTIKTEKTHSQIILPLCKKLLDELNISLKDIEKIAVSKGPGSYTGIRIGISAAKAVSYALGIKCCGVSSLFSAAIRTNANQTPVCSIITARQDLVYCAVYRNQSSKDFETILEEQIMDKKKLYELLISLNEKIIITGTGAEDFCREYKSCDFSAAEGCIRDNDAVSLCRSSCILDETTPELLRASYLQLTEAERNLNNLR